ncbi:MAG TPA: glycine zipper 2TM domain-containing protein [Xanthomonadaceae bacterium]|nr:glycine zipper 2TM domain-containing protein [Xanthomonadaceae bacterium]
MRSSIMKSGVIALAMLFVVACASNHPRYGDSRYGDSRYQDTRQTGYGYGSRCNYCGTIQNIHTVWERDRASGGGAVLGAIIGGVVGSNVGSGSGRQAATIGGAVAGGVIGHQIEQEQNRGDRQVYLIEVSMDDGRWAEVTQRDVRGLRPGDRVVIRNQQVHVWR